MNLDDTAEQIFLGAIQLPEGEARREYIEAACGHEPALKKLVLSLLEAKTEMGDFLKTLDPSASDPERTIPGERAESEQTPGDLIGPYKLLQRIGEGGFGEVFMAEQQTPMVRMVALKIIKLGMDTKSVIARFEAERQALAMMDHPNIAKVLDAGSTEQGRPYFVMELVKGIPITQFCDEKGLNTQQRLTLFADVCSAIQHAHQKGIIHRDVKPSNILVTLHGDKAVPKVIDFGIAKATQQRLTEKTLFTNYGQFIGTPAYMSPEQATMSGLDIDTRSDVYSLGILLYELLTGHPPFDAKELLKAGFEEIRRRIREEEPPKPSTRLVALNENERTTITKSHRVDPQKLSILIRGDLDWIVMKAIDKDRSRRYESASSLAEDIQRHLQDEPVLAAAPTLSYRIQKFSKKHRTGIGIAASFLLLLIASAFFSSVQAIRATRAAKAETEAREGETEQRKRAEANAELAKKNEASAVAEKLEADEQRKRAIQLSSRGDRQMGERLLDQGLIEEGLLYLSRSLQYDPTNEATFRYLMSALAHRRIAQPIREPILFDTPGAYARFSPDGRYYAFVDIAERLTIVDLQSATRVSATRNVDIAKNDLSPAHGMNLLEFSPGNNFLVVVEEDSSFFSFWNPRSGQNLGNSQPFNIDTSGENPFALLSWRISADGRFAYCTFLRDSSYLYRCYALPSGQLIREQLLPDANIQDLSVSTQKEELIIRLTSPSIIRIAPLVQGQIGEAKDYAFPPNAEPDTIRFDPSGLMVAYRPMQPGRQIVPETAIWNLETGESILSIPFSPLGIFPTHDWSLNGLELFRTFHGNAIQRFNARTGELKNQFSIDAGAFERGHFKPLLFAGDARTMVIQSRDGDCISLVGSEHGNQIVAPIQADRSPNSGHYQLNAVAPQGTQNLAYDFFGEKNGVSQVSFSGSSAQGYPLWDSTEWRFKAIGRSWLASCWIDRTSKRVMKILNHADNRLENEAYRLGSHYWSDVQLSSSGTHIVAISSVFPTQIGSRLVVFERGREEPLNQLDLEDLSPIGSGHVRDYAINRDGSRVAFYTTRTLPNQERRSEIWIWHPTTGRPPTLVHDRVGVRSVNIPLCLSDDGARLAALDKAESGGTFLFQEDESWQKRVIAGQTKPIAIGMSPNGKWLATAHPNATILLRDLDSEETIQQKLPNLEIRSQGTRIHFSEDSQWLCLQGNAKEIVLWDRQRGQLGMDAAAHGMLFKRNALSPNGLKVLSYEVPEPPKIHDTAPVMMDTPEWFHDFVSAYTGRELNTTGAVQFTDRQTAHALRKRIQAMEPSSELIQWTQWLLNDPEKRTISPYSDISFPDWIGQLTKGSIEDWRQAYRLAPLDPRSLAKKALLDIATASTLDAKQCQWYVDLCLTRDPDFADGWFAQAVLLAHQSEWKESLTAVQKAIANKPNEFVYHYLMGTIYEALDAWAPAAMAFLQASHCPINPNDRYALCWNWGRTHREAFARSRMDDQEGLNRIQQTEWLIPERAANTPDRCLDLTPHYNSGLIEGWHNFTRQYPYRTTPRDFDPKDFRDLQPFGLKFLGDTPFDVRGLIQLRALKFNLWLNAHPNYQYPKKIHDIRVDQKAEAIHFLHSFCNQRYPNENEQLGTYTIHYTDGSSAVFPIRYGPEILPWFIELNAYNEPNPSAEQGPQKVWHSRSTHPIRETDERESRLFKTIWQNPRSDRTIDSISLESNEIGGGIFVVAITLEDTSKK